MMKNEKWGKLMRLAALLLVVPVLAGCELGSSDDSGLGSPGEGGGFLWKPVSESNGRLVVLTPPQYTGNIASCFIANGDGSPIEQGGFGGVHNGGREHFRFSKPGGAYGNNVNVVADLKNGDSVYWVVPNGSQRTQF